MLMSDAQALPIWESVPATLSGWRDFALFLVEFALASAKTHMQSAADGSLLASAPRTQLICRTPAPSRAASARAKRVPTITQRRVELGT